MNFDNLNLKGLTEEAEHLFEELFPICRSITGNGVRNTLSILNEVVGFETHEVKSGTKCYDWSIPNEWNVNDAYVEDSNGKKIIDFKKNNLHLVSYSTAINKTLSFNELSQHLNTLPNLPDAIPYRTSYYNEDWGFCIAHNELKNFDQTKKYHVVIDSTLKPGSMTYGEKLINGSSNNEFLFSSYCCHPSLANDGLSGLILWALLLKQLNGKTLKNSYRFVAIPETIGSIYYLSSHETEMKNITGGFVLTCTAGPSAFSYKKTFLDNHPIDKIVIDILENHGEKFSLYPFDINGSDERQYSAPFFRIPIGTISRDKYFEYSYYHTSKDDLEFVSAENLVKTLQIYLKIIEKLEEGDMINIKKNEYTNSIIKKKGLCYGSLNPYCEPMLSKRGLYPLKGGMIKQKMFDIKKTHDERDYSISNQDSISGKDLNQMLWVLFYSDGQTSIQTISEITNIPLSKINEVVKKLEKVKLIKKI